MSAAEDGGTMEVDAPAAPFETLRILKLVKDAQQMHGLRHGSYKRYGDYCGRRMQRLRRALKATHQQKNVSKHRAKFQYKKITPDLVNDQRFLELLIFNVEHCWAQGMDFKLASENENQSRKKFHSRNRLCKSLQYARELEQLADACTQVNSLTKLEAKAYNAFIAGTLHLEKAKWVEALEQFQHSKKIYEKLAEIDGRSEVTVYYEGRGRELANMIKVCEYNSGGTASPVVPEMMSLSLGEDGMDIDKLIRDAQSATAGGGTAKTIKWAGETVGVPHEAVRQALEAIEKAEQDVGETADVGQKLQIFEKAQATLREAVQKFNEEKAKSKLGEAQQNEWQTVGVYLDFVRHRLAAERYVLQAANLGAGDKKPKPQAFLRIFAEVVDNCEAILKLPGADGDADLQSAFGFKAEFYKCKKCFHLAQTYGAMGQEAEAVKLFDRALERKEASAKLLQKVKKSPFVSETADDLKRTEAEIKDAKKGLVEVRLAEAKAKKEKKEAALAALPKPTPAKPVFFDLALKHITVPQQVLDVAESPAQSPKEEQQAGSGIMGGIKSFIWGSSR
ncbi:Signal recognition particle subunit SRP68 [Aphelenchoides fujianensis]|nr:Signal recognition particle subunit SRP68 [Aphelenchoides fujianensis]